MTTPHEANPTKDQLPSEPMLPPGRSSRTSLVMGGILLLVALLATTSYLAFNTNPKTPPAATASLAPAVQTPATVSITASGFVPATISIKPGQAVIWTNTDSSPHVIASDPYPNDNTLPNLNSRQALLQGSSYSYVFATAGTYTYHDNRNPALTGTVVVR